MNKVLLTALGFFAAMGSVNAAHAEPMTCELSYSVDGGGLQLGVGYFKLKGDGILDCMDSFGILHTRLVKVTLGGSPIAARIGAGYLFVTGQSASFGFNGDMNDLYGSYLLAEGNAAVGLGVGAHFSIQNPINGLRMTLGITGSYGLGAEAGISLLKISPQ